MSSYQVSNLSQLATEVPEGMRTVRIITKRTAEELKSGVTKQETKGCFVPTVSNSFANQFASLHPDIVAYWIEQQQDKIVRSIWLDKKRSPSESDLGMESIVESFNAEEKADRLTVEQIKAALAGSLGIEFINYLANARNISLVNQPENVAMLTQVKNNYLPFFSMATARKPAFESAGIKEKVVSVMCGFGDWLIAKEIESVIVTKALEKMLEAPVKTVDVDAL